MESLMVSRRSGRRMKSVSTGSTVPLLVVLVALASIVLAAAGAASGSGRAAKPVLRFGVSPCPCKLDPSTRSGLASSLVYEPLLKGRPDGSFVPGLATSWRYIKAKAKSGRANKDFEITLRRNARFSTGELVTASAVKGYFEYVYRAKGPTWNYLGPNPTFEAIGKWTVRIHMTVPNPNVQFLLAQHMGWGLIAPPAPVADPKLFETQTWGAGPYLIDLSASVALDHYRYIPNPYYYDKSKIKWSEINTKVITVPTSALQAIQAGQLDITVGDASTANAAIASGYSVAQGLNSTVFLQLNTTVKPFDDVRVRQAMNYAIDRKKIVSALFGPYGKPVQQFLTGDSSDPSTENLYAYNPAKAKALLTAAGYPNGFTTKCIAMGFAGTPGLPLMQSVAQDLAAVGINFDIVNGSTISVWFQQFSSGTYPCYQTGVAFFPTQLMYPRVYSQAADIAFHRAFPVIDKLYYQGIRQQDPSKYWQQIISYTVKQALYVPLYQTPALLFVSKRIGGVAASKATFGIAFPEDWYPK